MTFAWYGHLKNMNGKPLFPIILLSWGIAFFYMKQPLKRDYLWAGFCLTGAAHFMFREGMPHV
jgi:uncharacterized protein (DUF486 family)